jgi:hypothetical protein
MLTKRYKWFRKDHNGELVEPQVQPYAFATIRHLNEYCGFESEDAAVSALEKFLVDYNLSVSKYDDYFLVPVWSAQ